MVEHGLVRTVEAYHFHLLQPCFLAVEDHHADTVFGDIHSLLLVLVDSPERGVSSTQSSLSLGRQAHVMRPISRSFLPKPLFGLIDPAGTRLASHSFTFLSTRTIPHKYPPVVEIMYVTE